LGKFPLLRMNEAPRESPPLVLGALGPKTLALAGRHYDGVLLHPFLTNRAIEESVALVRAGEESAGKPPGSCKIWSTLVVAADQSEEETSTIGPARLLTYVQVEWLGDLLCRVNGWDASALASIRSHPMFAGGKSADQNFTRYETAEVAAMFPDDWMADSAALGTAADCAERINDQFDAGVDGVLFHGSVARQLPALLDAYRSVRQSEYFEDRDPWFRASEPSNKEG